jgi:hypothetical protein
MNRVDLFVAGPDFYLGSTKLEGRLKDGWCDFSKLGRQKVGDLGSSYELGRVWYLNGHVSPYELRSFGEHERQAKFLSMMGSEVTPLIFGRNCRFKTEKEAISWLGNTSLALNAMVISGDLGRQTPLLSLLGEKYPSRQPLILVPPDFEMENFGRSDVKPLSHDDLEAAQLERDDVWHEYEESRDRREEVVNLVAAALGALGPGLTVRLNNKGPHRDPESWEKWANDNGEIRKRTDEQVARFIGSPNEYRSSNSNDPRITFIARRIIKDVAAQVAKELWGQVPESRPSIRNGRDLMAQAASVYPAIEIGEDAEKDIRKLCGNEKHFHWVLVAFAAANRETLAWKRGQFQHHHLPGPATGESDPTMRQFGEKRIFKTRNGDRLPFEHHMKCRAENQRIHYRVDEGRRLLMIGYVGKHLPTVGDPT